MLSFHFKFLCAGFLSSLLSYRMDTSLEASTTYPSRCRLLWLRGGGRATFEVPKHAKAMLETHPHRLPKAKPPRAL